MASSVLACDIMATNEERPVGYIKNMATPCHEEMVKVKTFWAAACGGLKKRRTHSLYGPSGDNLAFGMGNVWIE